MCKITSSNYGIHIYLSGCNCGFGFEEKYWQINGFGEKKAWIGRFKLIYIPLFNPSDKLQLHGPLCSMLTLPTKPFWLLLAPM